MDALATSIVGPYPAGPSAHFYRVSESDRHSVRASKLERIARGGDVRLLDLFAGCGGLSLGFQAAGMAPWAAVEHDPYAAESHALNFFSGAARDHKEARDVSVSPFTFAKSLGVDDAHSAVDVLVGGPPCQAFARVGRAKLREVADHPEAFKLDDRAQLYLNFLAYIEAFQPLAVVMENVPDVLNFGGANIPEEVCGVLESRGYVCRYSLLNSVHYGVPQMRERMFLIALTAEMAQQVTFPEPTNHHVLPSGYDGTRAVALKMLGDMFAPQSTRFRRAPVACADLPPAVTAREALADLPPISAHLEGKLKRGARRFTELARYAGPPSTPYARLMRGWSEFECTEGVYDHVIRSLPRDYKIFRRMRPGDQYPQAHELAKLMLEEELDRRLGPGTGSRERSLLRETLRAEFVPPYDVSKFPNKWRKMEPDAPARTLMAHLGKDSYSHIHYDSEQARTISVREAARLQSFPDGFRFAGTMNPAFRQIGNAVPPLLAKSVATAVMSAIRSATR